MNARSGVLCTIAVIAACGCSMGSSARHAEVDPKFARAVAETAAVASVARPGAQVCREMRVGIAERDWVRGVVLEADGARVKIRIEAPGRFHHAIGGITLAIGAVVSDDAIAWTPCR